jgi:hypothetical protein
MILTLIAIPFLYRLAKILYLIANLSVQIQGTIMPLMQQVYLVPQPMSCKTKEHVDKLPVPKAN